MIVYAFDAILKYIDFRKGTAVVIKKRTTLATVTEVDSSLI